MRATKDALNIIMENKGSCTGPAQMPGKTVATGAGPQMWKELHICDSALFYSFMLHFQNSVLSIVGPLQVGELCKDTFTVVRLDNKP